PASWFQNACWCPLQVEPGASKLRYKRPDGGPVFATWAAPVELGGFEAAAFTQEFGFVFNNAAQNTIQRYQLRLVEVQPVLHHQFDQREEALVRGRFSQFF